MKWDCIRMHCRLNYLTGRECHICTIFTPQAATPNAKPGSDGMHRAAMLQRHFLVTRIVHDLPMQLLSNGCSVTPLAAWESVISDFIKHNPNEVMCRVLQVIPYLQANAKHSSRACAQGQRKTTSC